MDWFDLMKSLKDKSGMTNHEISEESGVPEPTLEKIFSGATKKPGINTVIDIIHAMGGTLDSIDPAVKKEQPADDDELSKVEIDFFNEFRALPASHKGLAASLCLALIRELVRHQKVGTEKEVSVPAGSGH